MTSVYWVTRYDTDTVAPVTPPPPVTYVTVPFTVSNSWTCPAGVVSVAALIVGGGGAGANGLTSVASNVSGAGGGGGGVVFQTIAVTPGTTYPVTVGAGGAVGLPGGDSVFNGVTAYGGDSAANALNAGSGVGGMWETGTGGVGHILPTNGTTGQGNPGGDCYLGGTTAQRSTTAGGGGGAGATGSQPGAANTGGAGGAGTTVTFPDLSSYTVGGGGGGGAGGLGTLGAGGSGGGGAGGTLRVAQTTFTADLFATSLTVVLSIGSTTSMQVGDYVVGNLGLQGIDPGAKVASIVNATTFTLDKYPTADTPGAVFGAYKTPGDGGTGTGGGGGGAGRTSTNCGFAVPGGAGGSGLVVIQYAI